MEFKLNSKTVYILGIILTFRICSVANPDNSPGKTWYELADSHISKLFIDSIVPEATPIHDKPPSSELYTFQPHAEIKSILQYATTNVGNEAVLRTTDDSIIIEKTLNEKGIPEFKIGGTVTLKEVLANLQYYAHWEVNSKTRTKFTMDISEEETSFYLKESVNKHGPYKQITVYPGKGKAAPYSRFMPVLEKVEKVQSSYALANSLLEILDTPMNEQKKTNILANLGNEKVREAVMDFLTVTHVAEASIPTIKALATFKEGIGLVQDYDNQIKNELDVGKKAILEKNKQKEIQKLVSNIEKRGRIPLMDKSVRAHLRNIKNGEGTFKDAFSPNEFPLRQRQGTHKGRLDILMNRGGDYLSDDERSELLATDKARADGQNELVRKRTADEMSIADRTRSKLCNRRRSKRAICSGTLDEKALEIDQNSIVIEHDKIHFTLSDSRDGSFQHESVIEIKPEELVHENFIAYVTERGMSKTGSRVSQKVSKILGIYGIFAGIGASKRSFDNGDKTRGSLFLSQSVYMTGNLIGLDRVVNKIYEKVGSKVLSSLAVKLGVEKVVEKLTDKLVSSGVQHLVEGVPVIGLGFDIFFIEEDIRDLVDIDIHKLDDLAMLPLKIINLETDIASTVLSLLGPEMEPFVLALTIFRMGFDFIYVDIYKELKKVNWHSPWAPVEAAGAYVVGYYEGLADMFTGGLVSKMNSLRTEVDANKKLIQDLSQSSNYYSIQTTGDSEAINFLSGASSYAGGDIKFRLGDDGFADIEIKRNTGGDKGKIPIKHRFKIDSRLNDIILGIGESRIFTHSKKHISWFIPWKSYNIICGEKSDRSSLHGAYYGNSNNNKFFAVQDIPNFQNKETNDCATKYGHLDSKEVLQRYHYELFGNNGNDIFFLGPQISFVQGGEDTDMYIVQAKKGKAYINNFSHKIDNDVLFLNISFSELLCYRLKDDLWISERSEDRVKVENYFKWSYGEHYKHLTFKSADGEIFHPKSTREDVNCVVTALDYSDKSGRKDVDLTLQGYNHVISVVGTKFSDKIHGNVQNNVLDTGGGDDFLYGGEGSDTYIIRNENLKGSQRIIINNKADDKEMDVLIIEVPYSAIIPNILNGDLQFSCHPGLNIQLTNWLIDDDSDHISFVSGDNVMFDIVIIEDKIMKVPKIVDLSKLKNGVQLDMQGQKVTGTSVPVDILPRVFTVSDSPFDDSIFGNSHNNFLSCSGGNDVLRGNAGLDKYVVKDGCKRLQINNYDEDEDDDMLFLFIEVGSLVTKVIGYSLVLTVKNAEIELYNWFQDSKYRHLTLHLKDTSVLELPEFQTDLTIYILEINKDLPAWQSNEIDLESVKTLTRLKRVRFTSKNTSYIVKGNEMNNFFHLGPSVPGKPQYIEGRNGTDVYEIGCGDGEIVINNYATDLLIDHLKVEIFYDDIEIIQQLDDVLIRSRKMPDHLSIVIRLYSKSVQYQHLQIHTSDGVTLEIVGTYNDIRIHVLQMDMSRADSSRHISLANNPQTSETQKVYGSLTHSNYIDGNNKPNKLIGGCENDEIWGNNGNDWIEGDKGDDVLNGGNGDDLIFGGEGNDIIYGNDGNDVIYPGSGTDTVDGGEGIDTVVLKGDYVNKVGIYINLAEGFGLGADADNNLYISIENAIGTDLPDTLTGSDGDNLLRGYGGEDTIIPLKGHDYLFGGEGKDTFDLSEANGIKTIDNYAKDEIEDIFHITSLLLRHMCPLRYNMSLYLSFQNETSERLDLILFDWYEGNNYQHAKFELKDTTLNSEKFLKLNNEQLIVQTFDELTIWSTNVNGVLSVYWDSSRQHIIKQQGYQTLLAYRETDNMTYTEVNIEDMANFTIPQMSNYEIRILFVKCGRILGFTKPHYAFSSINLNAYCDCYQKPIDCYVDMHFNPKTVTPNIGWMVDFITVSNPRLVFDD
jgi:Ca2+-binding RTX toxin-like protein